jgi:hypothetical protein
MHQPIEQSATVLGSAHDLDGKPCSTSSVSDITKICDEAVGLVKEAIVTVTSAVVEPLKWESDCTSALRQLTRVLGLVGTLRDRLSAEGLEAAAVGPGRPRTPQRPPTHESDQGAGSPPDGSRPNGDAPARPLQGPSSAPLVADGPRRVTAPSTQCPTRLATPAGGSR